MSEIPTCRICFDEAHENGHGELIAPCLCRGSMKYVHRDCLNSWRMSSTRENSFCICEQCNYRYKMVTNLIGKICSSEVTTSVCFVSLTSMYMCVLYCICQAFFPQQFFQYTSKILDLTNLLQQMQIAITIPFVESLFVIGIIGIGMALREKFNEHRHTDYSWLGSTIVTILSQDRRISIVFIILGIHHAFKNTFKQVSRILKIWSAIYGTYVLDISVRSATA